MKGEIIMKIDLDNIKIKVDFGGSFIAKDNKEIVKINENYNNLSKEEQMEVLKLTINVFNEQYYLLKFSK